MSFSDNEWRMLRAIRPNILVIGAADFVESTVSAIVAELPGPVSYLRPNAPPPVMEHAEMLVMPDVGSLSEDRQREWLTWLSEMDVRRPQIVATSGVPVYPLVKKEQFSGTLYYRLNTILLDVQTTDEGASRAART
jgi:Sigma-54 interaction domain